MKDAFDSKLREESQEALAEGFRNHVAGVYKLIQEVVSERKAKSKRGDESPESEAKSQEESAELIPEDLPAILPRLEETL